MATTRRTRTIHAPIERLWETIGDPHHLPRWWPRVERVEDVTDTAFTEVLRASSGRAVRADFTLLAADTDAKRLRWAQQLQGTPFARVLRSSEVEIHLVSLASDATEVTIALHQVLAGFLPRLGSFLARRAAGDTLDEAMDGLERIGG